MSFTFNFEFKKDVKTIRAEIDNKFGEAQEDFIERVEESYGAKYVDENMFESGRVFRDRRKVYQESMGGSRRWISQIGQLYKEAWEEKYEEIQKQHKAYAQIKGYIGDDGLTPHLRRKKANQGQQAPHAPATVKFESDNPWTIWTGLFREKVGNAFTEDFSNEYVEITNLLLSGGFRMMGEGYPHMYDKFTDWFQEKTIILGQPFEIDDVQKWNEIGNIMGLFAERNFVDPFIDVFNKLDIKV